MIYQQNPKSLMCACVFTLFFFYSINDVDQLTVFMYLPPNPSMSPWLVTLTSSTPFQLMYTVQYEQGCLLLSLFKLLLLLEHRYLMCLGKWYFLWLYLVKAIHVLEHSLQKRFFFFIYLSFIMICSLIACN